jgi:hypothetical protein
MYDKFLFIMDDMHHQHFFGKKSHIILPSMRVFIKISHSQKALLAYNPKTYIIWKFCEWKIFGDDHTAIRLKISVQMETFGDDRALE